MGQVVATGEFFLLLDDGKRQICKQSKQNPARYGKHQGQSTHQITERCYAIQVID
jgi:hypothetical protein